MKKTISVRNKYKLTLVIIATCGVVFISNYRIKKVSQQIGESIESIYKDRLLAQDLLFSYYSLLDNLTLDSQSLLSEGLEIKRNYLNTSSTNEEEQLLHDFSTQLEIGLKEKGKLSNSKISELKTTLARLESIQIEEAKKEMSLIKRARSSEELGYYLETAILIVLLLIVHILIYSNNFTSRIKLKNPKLN